jgi:hypothetical protein
MVTAAILERGMRILDFIPRSKIGIPQSAIGDRVERFLGQVLQQLGHERVLSHRDDCDSRQNPLPRCLTRNGKESQLAGP